MLFFSIPDTEKLRVCDLGFLQAVKAHKEWFFDDFKIDTVYGTPGRCIWNGTKVLLGEGEISPENWGHDIANYLKFGAGYRLMFTNFMLEWKHLQDEYANAIAAELDKLGGQVFVTTEFMEKHIKKHYSNLKVGWGTFTNYGNGYGEQKQIERINRLSAEEIVVPPYDFNNKFELLDKLSHPENIELLLNVPCMDDCRFKIQHATLSNLMNCGSYNKTYCIAAQQLNMNPFVGVHRHTIKRNILKKYAEKGFCRFTLIGRDYDSRTLFPVLLEYFARPEFYQQIAEYVNEFGSGLLQKAKEQFQGNVSGGVV